MLVMTASLLGWVLARAQVPQMLGAWILGTTHNPLLILLMINVFLLIVGCFMEALAALIILVPVFMPVIKAVGIDPGALWFGRGPQPDDRDADAARGDRALFVVARVAKLPFEQVTRATAPFLIPLVVVLLLITVFPELVLWLPRVLFG